MPKRFAACVVGAALCLSGVAVAQSAQPAPDVRSVPASQDYVFPAGTALLLFYVHPERAADFEAVAAKIAQALDASAEPQRRQQAASWRMFRSAESSRDLSIYVFLLDPAIAGADYDPVRVLSETLPAEVQALYDRLKSAVIRVERMTLLKLR